MNDARQISAPAKINLTLDVLRQREDGYHNIESIMQTVELEDRLILEKQSAGINLEVADPDIPRDGDNLAYQAARLMFDTFNLPGGIKIKLEKNIPLQAGLAGGSTDAAAVIRDLASAYNVDLYCPEVLNLAARVGSDVPFFLRGGTALISGRGERIWDLPDLSPRPVCLLVFPFGLSTREIYQGWRGTETQYRSRRALPAVFADDWEGLIQQLGNDLEAGAVEKVSRVGEVLEKIRQSGLGPAHISGSGPTIVVYDERTDYLEKLLAPDGVKIIKTRTRGKDSVEE